MKLKYYLRGLGIGIIVSTIILMVSFSTRNEEISDQEVIERAEALGMMFPEENIFGNTETEVDTEVSTEMSTEVSTEVGTEISTENSVENVGANNAEAVDHNDTEENSSEEISNSAGTVTDTSDENVADSQDNKFVLSITYGDSCRMVCEKLQVGGVIENSEELRTYLYNVGYAQSIVVGDYEVPYGASYEEIHRILAEGPA